MTEAEWLASFSSVPMLAHLLPTANQRKLLLFAVACCRRIWEHIPDDRGRRAVIVIEAVADGQVSDDERRVAAEAAHRAAATSYNPPTRHRAHGGRAAEYAACAAAQTTNTSSVWGYAPAGYIAASGSAHCCACAMKFVAKSQRTSGRPAAKKERRHQANLLRCIFGNPFRPVAANHDWLTSDVIALAGRMYESRDFSPMPILADALQDAGCEDEAILSHCRGEGLHARGCHVIDLILGKA